MTQRYKSSLIALVFLLPSCTWWGQKTHAAPTSGLIVVNVLDPEYYDDAHIAGSINISVDDLDKAAQQWDKDAEIIFYCTNYWCTSSGYAAGQLAKQGFKKVYAYEGGMAEWHQKGYPSEGPRTKSYLSKVMKPFADEEEPKGYTIITTDELHQKMQAQASEQ